MKNNDKILCGDSLEVLKDFEDNYFDSVVTDPPYGLAFMGKKWDYDVPQVELWKEVYRVLKPGGYILSFAGSRTYHRMAVNIEDAGFEIRDMLGWLYGSGFPKSHNIGKAVESKLKTGKSNSKSLRKVEQQGSGESYTLVGKNNGIMGEKRIYERKKFIPETEQAKQWEGWGTALKPAHEPIVMARKPFNTTVAENVLTHSTGGINIDECRVDGKEGRFPANIIHDGSEEVLEIFPETEQAKSRTIRNFKGWKNEGNLKKHEVYKDDSNSAARFFYCAKASKAERNMGLDDFPDKVNKITNMYEMERNDGTIRELAHKKNYHPTVKPIKLMEYLVRLVTPKEGIVLEPFAGSGTTLIACKQQGFNYIGIEREQEYCDIAEARLKGVQIQGTLF